MLENIKDVDPWMSHVPEPSFRMRELLGGYGSGSQSAGSGDIYDSIPEFTPLAPLCLCWNLLPGFLTRPLADANRRGLEFLLGLRDRKIPLVGAETYNYKRPFDQSGDTLERLAQISRERYPSNAYEEFQLVRSLMGEIDKETLSCLVGKEHEPRQQPESGGLRRHMVLDVNWHGPGFHKLVRGFGLKVDWDRVLTITKTTVDGEYYIPRSVSDFLSEFYGVLGISLLEWVDRLCQFKTREIPKEITIEETIAQQKKIMEGTATSASVGIYDEVLDRVHLHVAGDSITAIFEDASLCWKMPLETSGAKIDRVLSALRWIVSVFQSLEATPGIFRVGCQVDDSSSSWRPSREPFEAGKKESSCWTQLFDSACVAEMPPSLHFDVGERPEGLEIRWDQLLDLTKVSRSWDTKNGFVLFGVDTALVQLVPVETRRWHVVRRPGELISPLHVEKLITSSLHPEALRQEFEFWGSMGANEGAIKSWAERRHKNRGKKSDQENFSYQKGTMVYVGWCNKPTVRLSTEAPSLTFLNKFDQQTTVPAVTKDIIALKSVTNVTVWNLAVSLSFMGAGVTGGVAHQHAEARDSQQMAIDLQSNGLLCARIRRINRTPCILWDDTLRRAWLVPGTCALLFVSLCYFARLGLTFDREIEYAESSNDAATSAENCIRENGTLELTNEREPRGITFLNLVLKQWRDMEEAQKVCYSHPNNMKHVKPGIVFGYGLYDLLGTGRVALRYLDERTAGASLRSWEPLARQDTTQVIFCRSVGQVISCDAGECPGAPCGRYCESNALSVPGILAGLLQDFKRFFGERWDQYEQRGTLLVGDGFEWVPRGRNPFGHTDHPPHDPGKPCQCCDRLERLQAIIPVKQREFILKRALRKWLGRGDGLIDPMLLEQRLAVRFGLVGEVFEAGQEGPCHTDNSVRTIRGLSHASSHDYSQ